MGQYSLPSLHMNQEKLQAAYLECLCIIANQSHIGHRNKRTLV